MQESFITDPSVVAELRRKAQALGRGVGFSEEDCGRLSIVITELGTNLLKHAGGGRILMGYSASAAQPCINVIALDNGAGMDVDKCLVDGFSTAGTQGNGLGAVRRQATMSEAYSQPGLGTAVLARLCPARLSYSPKTAMAWGLVARPFAGEDVSGDDACVRDGGEMFCAMMADGLGHGAFAAKAAAAAVDCFSRYPLAPADEMLEAIHAALRPTRGAAVSVASIDLRTRIASYCGLGNVMAVLIEQGATRKLTNMNGTAGVVARRVQAFQYPLRSDALLVMHSDGVSSNWSLDKYPGLLHCDPLLIAAVLYRDFGKTRDDASVLVAKVAL
jgi:anti-sigma regulatory factor (Ser/Thr protein kinase)